MAKFKYGLNLEDPKHQEEIAKAVAQLPLDVQIVVAKRFGLLGMDSSGATVTQLSRQLGLPKLKIEAAIAEGARIIRTVIEARPTTRAGRARKALGLEDLQPTLNRPVATLGDILGLTTASSNC